MNPWIKYKSIEISRLDGYIPRVQESFLLNPEWDDFWLLLIGPRRAGKTTLGRYIAQILLKAKRFDELLYLNCDYDSVRKALVSASLFTEIFDNFALNKPIIFIDEVQRLQSPGLFLKAVIDRGTPEKLMASGSSQLEIKSEVQEYLTGREIEATILPLSEAEVMPPSDLESRLLYGTYPKVILSNEKKIILQQLYKRYIEKDIIKVLRLSKPDVMEKLIVLLAHSSGQLINYQQLANNCRVSIPTVQSYLSILEQTFVIVRLAPFVGNKRTEITSNPTYYFIDNGFRNQVLRNFTPLSVRSDVGLLVESFVFQEIYK